MISEENGIGRLDKYVPSMLDLVNLGHKPLFPPGGVELYRQIAIITDMKDGCELLVAPSNLAFTLEYFVNKYGVQGSGVESNSLLLERAEERLRELTLLDRVHVQHGDMDNIPFRDGIFDVVIGDIGITSKAEPETAVEEIIRVAKPGATVVVVQPVWKVPISPVRQALLSEHLGFRPLMLGEWKRILEEKGLRYFHIEDWSDEGTVFRPQISKPFPDFTEIFSLREKIGIFHQAQQRWGWGSMWAALSRARNLHKIFTKNRMLGLYLIKGVKSGGAIEPDSSVTSNKTEDPVDGEIFEVKEVEQVTGLPLFGKDDNLST
tara:strand:+ start:794 stop:1753 length:960 start_codon:yes stop_codon:yes gene_type:complete